MHAKANGLYLQTLNKMRQGTPEQTGPTPCLTITPIGNHSGEWWGLPTSNPQGLFSGRIRQPSPHSWIRNPGTLLPSLSSYACHCPMGSPVKVYLSWKWCIGLQVKSDFGTKWFFSLSKYQVMDQWQEESCKYSRNNSQITPEIFALRSAESWIHYLPLLVPMFMVANRDQAIS